MLKIYGPAMTRASRVIWTAEELGIAYELKPLNMREGEHQREPYLSINPNAKVPAIEDGSFQLSESGAILNYLADKFAADGKRLIPAAGSEARALHDQWMFFVLNDLEPPIWAWFKQILFVPEDQRKMVLLDEARVNFERGTKVVSKHLQKNEYMLGGSFGVVDVLMASVLGWGKYCDLPGIDATLGAYLQRATERPAYLGMQKKYFGK